MADERARLVVAVHVFLIERGRVLLLRRAGTGWGDGQYSVIAGHLDGGETVLAAAAREAREEAGIDLDPAATTVVGVMHRRSDDERIDFFVETTAWRGEPHNLELDKCDDLRWFSLDALPSNVVPYVRRAIENAREGVWFDSFGWSSTDG
ncbi:MAG TPA: NUDIX domain-containing protein [Thermomicrobiales bacterium]|nr:NUDIX domain-containing protein [Thermomicrobiales bacterium]